jgi:hypothetical protein
MNEKKHTTYQKKVVKIAHFNNVFNPHLQQNNIVNLVTKTQNENKMKWAKSCPNSMFLVCMVLTILLLYVCLIRFQQILILESIIVTGFFTVNVQQPLKRSFIKSWSFYQNCFLPYFIF